MMCVLVYLERYRLLGFNDSEYIATVKKVEFLYRTTFIFTRVYRCSYIGTIIHPDNQFPVLLKKRITTLPTNPFT